MLILSRRPDEAIVIGIGNGVLVKVLGYSGNMVRLGIVADPNIVVDREEVWERKQQEAARRAAASSGAAPVPAAKSVSPRR